MNSIIQQLQSELIKEEMKQAIKEAYLLGVEDGRSRFDYPYLLTKKDLAKIFQVELSTVNKIVGKRGFPKSNFVAGRYPRDDVFKWIEANCQRFS